MFTKSLATSHEGKLGPNVYSKLHKTKDKSTSFPSFKPTNGFPSLRVKTNVYIIGTRRHGVIRPQPASLVSFCTSFRFQLGILALLALRDLTSHLPLGLCTCCSRCLVGFHLSVRLFVLKESSPDSSPCRPRPLVYTAQCTAPFQHHCTFAWVIITVFPSPGLAFWGRDSVCLLCCLSQDQARCLAYSRYSVNTC